VLNMTSNNPAGMTSGRLNIMSFVLILGAFPTILNTTLVNIGLDNLRTTFDATVSDTQWVITAYLLAYVAVIPLTGWASERFGARLIWMFAVGAFLGGSLLCGFAWSLPSLVFFRVLQGCGGGMVLPVTLTILSRAAGRERLGGVISMIGFIGQLAPILGPVVGGSIIDSIGWHWLFFVNVPVGAVALVLAAKVVPAGQKTRGESFDLLGFVLLTPGVVALAYGVNQAGGAAGFAAPSAWLALCAGVALVTAFASHALRARRQVLLDVRVFARRSFGISSVMTFVSGFSTYALIFMLPLFYQVIRGESVFETGLLLIPQGVGTMCFILVNRRVGARIDTRLIIGTGVILTMAGILPFALAGAAGGDAVLLAGQFLQGFGLGAISIPIMTLAFSSLSPAETPRGSAAFNVVKQVGAPFGVTVIAVILQSYLATVTTNAQAAGAFNATFWWVFALSAIPLILAFFLPSPRERADGGVNREL